MQTGSGRDERKTSKSSNGRGRLRGLPARPSLRKKFLTQRLDPAGRSKADSPSPFPSRAPMCSGGTRTVRVRPWPRTQEQPHTLRQPPPLASSARNLSCNCTAKVIREQLFLLSQKI